MARTVTVGTETFEIPEVGANAGSYGEELTDFFVAVADALETVQQPNDILTTTAAINNNQSSPANVPGFVFDTSEVIQINAEATVTRSTTSPAVTLVENFYIRGNYDGTEWTITQDSDSQVDSGVSFDINSAGQIQYTSTNMTGSGYVGEVFFRARVFNQDS